MKLVHDSMFIVYPARPISRQCVLQWLGFANALERLSLATSWGGKPKLALEYLQKAARLNPREPYNFAMGVAYFTMHNYAEAITLLRKSIVLNPGFLPSQLYLGSSYGLNGQESEAKQVVAEIRRTRPNYRLVDGLQLTFKSTEDRQLYVDGLKIGGLT